MYIDNWLCNLHYTKYNMYVLNIYCSTYMSRFPRTPSKNVPLWSMYVLCTRFNYNSLWTKCLLMYSALTSNFTFESFPDNDLDRTSPLYNIHPLPSPTLPFICSKHHLSLQPPPPPRRSPSTLDTPAPSLPSRIT